MLRKRYRKTLRNISVFVLLTDTRLRKMSVVGEVTVSYPFTAIHRRLRTVSIDLGSLLTYYQRFHKKRFETVRKRCPLPGSKRC